MLFGDDTLKPLADAAKAAVRDPSNFDWTFIALLAFVVMMYVDELHKKNYKAVAAALMLYSVHWLYEIANAVICRLTGYALWTVSPESTTFILLIGVSWELSMMFSVAGFTSKLLPADPKLKILGVNNRVFFAVGSALFFSLVEIFLAWTPAFIWVYPWWGAIPVFLTVYIPFFLASYLIYDREPKAQKRWIGALAGLNIVLLAVLIPLGVI